MSNTSYVSCRSLASGAEPRQPSWLRLEQTCPVLPQPSTSPLGLGSPPSNRQSGGKRLRASTNKGDKHLRAVLAEVVWVISHTKDNYLSAQYHRLARREGSKRAIVTVSHSVRTHIYHMLRTNQDYHDLGPHYFETLDATRQRDTAVRRLQALGYKVSLEEVQEDSV